jgi:DegV family protein with EDD domain
MKIGLVTDGTCDLPASVAAEHHIKVVPHHVIWGEQTYTDGVNLTAQEFYERLGREKVLPKTAQPSAAEFADAFRAVQVQSNVDAILCVATSQRITGAHGSAVLASSMVDFPVRVIDSHTATVALGLTVLATADAIQGGADLDEAEQFAIDAAKRSHFYFTLDTLEYLYRGGRIGNAQRLVGSVLSIKPILNIQEGIVAPFENVRSRKKAIARLVEVATVTAKSHPVRLAVVHTNAPELDELSQTLRDALQPDQFFQSLACSPVGVYAGPRSIGIGVLCGV